jgi:hypothetical protein
LLELSLSESTNLNMELEPRNKMDFIFKWLFIVLLSCSLLLAISFFRSGNLALGIIMLLVPFVVLFISMIFIRPIIGFITMFFANYFVMGISRYIQGPLGLAVDGLLLLTWIAVVFSQFNQKVEWKKAWNGFTIVAILWFLYALFELVNPEKKSSEAWFYAMRGVSLYMMLTLPLTFLIFNQKKHLDLMIRLLAIFTLLAVAKGLMQKLIGPDPWEKYWLAVIGGKTHLLPGGLRVFSFFTDAATYGGSMGFAGVVFIIVALYTEKTRKKLFFFFVAFAAFYGMLISGTRGAMAVPFAGFTLFAILSKKIKILLIGGFLLISVFALLKYTTIGNNVYEIRRFRGGLSKDNDSFQVRMENQKKLKVYLASRPFGGGIGSAGNWGLRFSPGTFLAQTPTDSWFVQIWAEQGIVGLTLHIGILCYFLLTSAIIIMFKLKTLELKGKAMAFSSGIFGIIAASYGSGALGQMPNGIIIYISLAFIYMMPEWEKTIEH